MRSLYATLLEAALDTEKVGFENFTEKKSTHERTNGQNDRVNEYP